MLWADIEQPEIAPAPDNGWNSVYTSPCSGVVRQSGIPAAIDRAEFTGFASFIASHSTYKVGVYSARVHLAADLRNRQYAHDPEYLRVDLLPATTSLSAAPTGWCLRGTSTCAQFFGGQTSSSKYALMWQWSGGGGVTNGYGDFDQIDLARMK